MTHEEILSDYVDLEKAALVAALAFAQRSS